MRPKSHSSSISLVFLVMVTFRFCFGGRAYVASLFRFLLSHPNNTAPHTRQVLKEIKKAEDPEDGRLCCELYKKVPPRREFKAYYEVIENPIDLQVCVVLLPLSC